MTFASDISGRLSARALAVCRHYLSNGHRQGNYWVVGDVANTPGRSLFVRLFLDCAGRPAGRWTDAATGEYGDLIDLIRHAVPSHSFPDALAEAERFLSEVPTTTRLRFRTDRPRSSDRERQAKSLYNACGPIAGTLAADYLTNRSIDSTPANGARFHPNAYCRPDPDSRAEAWPTLIVPVTDRYANLTGIHRLYLDPRGNIDNRLGKAPIETPKRSLGRLHGHAARFGAPAALVVVAEGFENALSIRTAFPQWTVHAALTAGNLAAYMPLAGTERLLIALDNDEAGRWAAQALAERAQAANLTTQLLRPRTGDHNADLRAMGLYDYRRHLQSQLQS